MHKFWARIFRALGKGLRWQVLYWANAKFCVGMSVVVTPPDGKSVLLQRHAYWPEGSWGLPSGYMNRGETVEETVERELREEIKLPVRDIRLLATDGGYRLHFGVILRATAEEGAEPIPDGKEVLESRFFALNELPQGLLVTHREIIQRHMGPPRS
jgi:8-oxo-dGTP diphosphatase